MLVLNHLATFSLVAFLGSSLAAPAPIPMEPEDDYEMTIYGAGAGGAASNATESPTISIDDGKTPVKTPEVSKPHNDQAGGSSPKCSCANSTKVGHTHHKGIHNNTQAIHANATSSSVNAGAVHTDRSETIVGDKGKPSEPSLSQSHSSVLPSPVATDLSQDGKTPSLGQPPVLIVEPTPAVATKATPATSSKQPSSSPEDSTMQILPVATAAVGDNATISASKPAKGVSLTSTMLYDLDNTGLATKSIQGSAGVKVDAGVYIVDMAGHSASQIKTYKDAGKTVICYFSAGTLEPFRDDVKNFEQACACGPGGKLNSNNECSGGSTKMDGWNEFWLDIHSPKCKTNVRDAMTKRIKAAKAKGCDGMDPDNVDSYSNKSPHGNTEADQVEYLLWLSKTIHAEGMIVDLKNSGDLLKSKAGASLVSAFDFSVIESCRQFNECDQYDAFLKAGKPQIQVEYSSSIKKCPTLKPGQNLAVYKGTVLNSKDINLWCPNPKTS